MLLASCCFFEMVLMMLNAQMLPQWNRIFTRRISHIIANSFLFGSVPIIILIHVNIFNDFSNSWIDYIWPMRRHPSLINNLFFDNITVQIIFNCLFPTGVRHLCLCPSRYVYNISISILSTSYCLKTWSERVGQ